MSVKNKNDKEKSDSEEEIELPESFFTELENFNILDVWNDSNEEDEPEDSSIIEEKTLVEKNDESKLKDQTIINPKEKSNENKEVVVNSTSKKNIINNKDKKNAEIILNSNIDKEDTAIKQLKQENSKENDKETKHPRIIFDINDKKFDKNLSREKSKEHKDNYKLIIQDIESKQIQANILNKKDQSINKTPLFTKSFKINKIKESIINYLEETSSNPKCISLDRRDPLKTKSAIEKDKELSLKKMQEILNIKKIKVAESGLVPPGLEDILDENEQILLENQILESEKFKLELQLEATEAAIQQKIEAEVKLKNQISPKCKNVSNKWSPPGYKRLSPTSNKRKRSFSSDFSSSSRSSSRPRICRRKKKKSRKGSRSKHSKSRDRYSRSIDSHNRKKYSRSNGEHSKSKKYSHSRNRYSSKEKFRRSCSRSKSKHSKSRTENRSKISLSKYSRSRSNSRNSRKIEKNTKKSNSEFLKELIENYFHNISKTTARSQNDKTLESIQSSLKKLNSLDLSNPESSHFISNQNFETLNQNYPLESSLPSPSNHLGLPNYIQFPNNSSNIAPNLFLPENNYNYPSQQSLPVPTLHSVPTPHPVAPLTKYTNEQIPSQTSFPISIDLTVESSNPVPTLHSVPTPHPVAPLTKYTNKQIPSQTTSFPISIDLTAESSNGDTFLLNSHSHKDESMSKQNSSLPNKLSCPKLNNENLKKLDPLPNINQCKDKSTQEKQKHINLSDILIANIKENSTTPNSSISKQSPTNSSKVAIINQVEEAIEYLTNGYNDIKFYPKLDQILNSNDDDKYTLWKSPILKDSVRFQFTRRGSRKKRILHGMQKLLKKINFKKNTQNDNNLENDSYNKQCQTDLYKCVICEMRNQVKCKDFVCQTKVKTSDASCQVTESDLKIDLFFGNQIKTASASSSLAYCTPAQLRGEPQLNLNNHFQIRW